MSEDNHSLGQRVFHRIREDILSGKYKKNEELKEKTIGEELGVSRTPVREALRKLELEGLVTIIPNKGAYVVGFSVEDIQDNYEICSVLGGLCARRAAAHVTKEQLEELEGILFLTDFHAQKGHTEQLVELDTRFHEILYEAGASKVLEHALRDYHHYLERVRKVTLAAEKRSVESNNEHKQILEALKEHNAKKAEEYANQHMLNTIRNIDSCGWEKIVNSPEHK